MKDGKVAKLNELPDGGWSADVAYDDGTFDHSVLPKHIAAIEGSEYNRVNFGSGTEAEINGQTVRAGDSIQFGPLSAQNGNSVNAKVDDVIRNRNPLDPNPDSWVIEATTDTGQRVTLTQERVGGNLTRIETTDDVPQHPGAKPLTINQKADVSHAYVATPGSQIVATDQIVPTRIASAADVQQEIARLSQNGEQRPPLLTTRRIDGKHELLERPEALDAARATGMTHLPVREARLPRGRALRKIDEAAESRRQAIARDDNPHDRGLLAGLKRAHEIVRNGGDQADIVAEASLRKGTRLSEFDEGYQVGLRQAWHEVDQAIKEAHLIPYATPRGSEQRYLEGVRIAGQQHPGSGGLWGWFHKKQGHDEVREPVVVGKLPVGGSGVTAEDAEGVRWHVRRRPGDLALQVRQHTADHWQEPAAGHAAGLVIVKSGPISEFSPGLHGTGHSQAAQQTLAGVSGVSSQFVERPFVPTQLKAHGPTRRALVRAPDGSQFRVEWAKEPGMMYLDAKTGKGYEQTPQPIKVEELPHGLVLTGFAPEQSYLPPAPPKPITDDGGQVTTTTPAGGSNGAMFAEDKAGTEWLVKTYRGDENRIATELLANSIYRELGITVPEAGELHFDGKVALGYPLLDGEEQKWDDPHPELGEGFMADALLANWDVVGLAQDNILWDPDGHPIRLDQGGTLSFRAMGDPKPFGPVPTEVWTMNQPNGQAFGRMLITPESKQAGAAHIAQVLTPERIDALVDAAPYKDGKMREKVREALHARVAWMGSYAAGEVSEPKPLAGHDAGIALAQRQAGMDLTPEEHLAATAWGEGWHTVVNDALRTKQPFNQASKEQKFLEKAMGSLTRAKQTKLTDAVEAWLTLPKTTLPNGGAGTVVGKTLHDPGFTNLSLHDPGEGTRVRVLISPGKSVLYLRGLPETPMPADAPELVLPRGSRIRIMASTDGVLDGVLV